jgi:hypothetical protein
VTEHDGQWSRSQETVIVASTTFWWIMNFLTPLAAPFVCKRSKYLVPTTSHIFWGSHKVEGSATGLIEEAGAATTE